MKASSIVKEVIGKFKENELIMASNLYKEKLNGLITEAAYYKTLQRMCEAGELVKIAKGTTGNKEYVANGWSAFLHEDSVKANFSDGCCLVHV